MESYNLDDICMAWVTSLQAAFAKLELAMMSHDRRFLAWDESRQVTVWIF